MNNKELCLQAIENNIALLKDFQEGKNISSTILFDPRHKSKYVLSFGFILCLIWAILCLLSLKIFVPNFMKYAFLSVGIIIIIVGIIIYVSAKTKSPIPYVNLKNVLKKISYSPKKQMANLTKKLIINNQNIAYYEKYNDKEINKKIDEFYKLLDIAYGEENSLVKNFILDDLKK